jgi:hypothetical protein
MVKSHIQQGKSKNQEVSIRELKHIWIDVSQDLKIGKYLTFYTKDDRMARVKVAEFKIDETNEARLGKVVKVMFN